MGIEQTIRSRFCVISASVYFKKATTTKKRKSKRTRKRWCQWRTMVERQRMFCWVLHVSSAGLKKFQTLHLAKHCLVLLLRWPTSSCIYIFVYRSTLYVHTNMYAASVCFCSPPNYDVFNACLYTYALFV